MSATTDTQIATVGAPQIARKPGRERRRGRPRLWRISIFVIAGIIFLVPILCSIKYSLQEKDGSYGLSNYTTIVKNQQIRSAALLSLELAAITAAITALIMIPTAVLVRLKLPKLTILMDGLTLLPFVVPPIVLAAGMVALQGGAPLWYANLIFNHNLTTLVPVYVVLSVPLFYRIIDVGLRSIDLHTLVEASRSLGAGWPSTLWRVVLPNIQSAILGGVFLAVAMVLGELVIANQFSINTFPVAMITVAAQLNIPGLQTALSLAAFGGTFLLLFLLTFFTRRRGARSSGRAR